MIHRRSAASFFWQLEQKNNNNNQEQEVSDEEDYLTYHRYEQERFTDEYSEYFQDDEKNKADRLTDDNA